MTENKYTLTQYSVPGVGKALEQQYSSPFPAPKVLKEYETLIPGAAADIIDQAKRQMTHRQDVEKWELQIRERVIKQEATIVLRGQIFAFVLVLAALVMGFWLISKGKDAQGLVSILAGVAVIAGSLIATKREPG